MLHTDLVVEEKAPAVVVVVDGALSQTGPWRQKEQHYAAGRTHRPNCPYQANPSLSPLSQYHWTLVERHHWQLRTADALCRCSPQEDADEVDLSSKQQINTS